jgi:hypothetical protein
MSQDYRQGLDFRLRSAGVHFLLSAVVIGLAAALVFLVWYPKPYASISGGLHLFLILASVDLFMGPLATAVVSSPGKPRREWYTDLTVIAVLQVAALGYGVWTMAQARPVYLAFEIDRFRVIHAIDVPEQMLGQAPEGFRRLPWSGPGLVAIRAFKNPREEADATFAALQGLHLGARPDLWTSYGSATGVVVSASMPLALLANRHPQAMRDVESQAEKAKVPMDQIRILPVAGRQDFWTALIDQRTGQPFGFLPIDGFEL